MSEGPRKNLVIRAAHLVDCAAKSAGEPLSSPSEAQSLSEAAQRGHDCIQIREEMKKIKNLARTRKLSIYEIKNDYPTFLVWALADSLKDEEEIFRNPRRWPAGYTSALLERYYCKSRSTIKMWIREFHRKSPS
jgi:hypothetical protein